MNNDLKLTIRKGSFILIATTRTALLTAQPSYDGMAFSFKENFNLTYSDQSMPISTKELITTSANSFLTASLDIDLGNYSKPVHASIPRSEN